mmetsp:Transcript_34814/g.87697  ORF Transcript_34814/g.87697 Transcript_34814/m.87697 type:complete len:543 (+) Transcript_34814:108-1736(+)|eukprot:jgi/Tetstr1/436399/TSEL_025230.t1
MGASESVPAGAGEADDGAGADAGARVRPSALVVCGPSGVGKGTLVRGLLETAPDDFGFSVSHTTRPPRPGEKDGDHYHFVSAAEFEAAAAAGEFLEHAHVHGNQYGTSLEAAGAVAAEGRCCVLDIDVQGARAVRASGLPAIFVFVAPPSQEELERRIRNRATETEEAIVTRISAAREELQSVNEPGLFDFIIVNDDLEAAQEQFMQVAQMALAGQDPAEAEEGGLLQPPSGSAPSNETDGAAEVAAEGVPPEGPGEAAESEDSAEAAAADGPGPSLEKVWADVQAGSTHSATTASPAEQSMDWAQKVAVVTGASSGIGWSTVTELLQSNVRVVAIARRREQLEKLQAEVLSLGIQRDSFLPIVLDVTKEAEVRALPKIINKRWPDSGIDILVNNAGVRSSDASLTDGSTASWVEMLSTNVLAVAMMQREAVADMERRAVQGHIITIGQLADAGGTGGHGFYHATKAAAASLTEGMHREITERGLPVRVTLISPSRVSTSLGGSEVLPAPELDASDVAAAVLWCLAAPPHVDVSRIDLRAGI